MDDLAHFLGLIIWNFWTVAAGIMLAFEPVMRWFVKEYAQVAARYIPPDSRRKAARFAALAAFVFANYLAFHDLSIENRALKADRDASIKGNSQSPYKWPMLTSEETVALRAKIREINPKSVSVSCAEDDCGDLARNFRDIFSGLHWEVMCCNYPFGGFDPGIHLWGETSELKGVAHDIEQATNGRLSSCHRRNVRSVTPSNLAASRRSTSCRSAICRLNSRKTALLAEASLRMRSRLYCSIL